MRVQLAPIYVRIHNDALEIGIGSRGFRPMYAVDFIGLCKKRQQARNLLGARASVTPTVRSG